MKRILVLAAFAALVSVPAHAQGINRASNGASYPTTGGGGYSGGGGGGYSGGGASGPLPSYPPTQFGVNAVSGTDDSFTPSAFLSYDQAVAVGKAAAAASTKTLAQAAEENSNAQKAKSKVVFVQDGGGNVVMLHR